MINLIRLEIKKSVKRREFLLILLLICFAIGIDFIVTCKQFYGLPMSSLISASNATILTNAIKTPLSSVFSILLPLTVSVIYSDCYLEEEMSGINNIVNTRVSRKKNIIAKAIAVVIVSFLIILIPLCINELLALIVFPIQGYNTLGIRSYKELSYIDKDIILHSLKIYYPYINLLVYIFLRALIAASLALISFGVSFINRINKYIVVAASFIFNCVVMTGMDLISQIISNEKLSIIFNTNILSVNGYGNLIFLIGIIAVYFLIGVFLVRRSLVISNL